MLVAALKVLLPVLDPEEVSLPELVPGDDPLHNPDSVDGPLPDLDPLTELVVLKLGPEEVSLTKLATAD